MARYFQDNCDRLRPFFDECVHKKRAQKIQHKWLKATRTGKKKITTQGVVNDCAAKENDCT
jgi:hypothetical protein